MRSSTDESIFAWTDPLSEESSIFASSPVAFSYSRDILPIGNSKIRRTPYSITNFGLSVEANLLLYRHVLDSQDPVEGTLNLFMDCWVMPLACARKRESMCPPTAVLQPLAVLLRSHRVRYVRVHPQILHSLETINISPRGYRNVYIKTKDINRKPPPSSQDPIVIGLSRSFRLNFRYAGIISNDPITFSEESERLFISEYTAKPTVIRFRRMSTNKSFFVTLSVEDGAFQINVGTGKPDGKIYHLLENLDSAERDGDVSVTESPSDKSVHISIDHNVELTSHMRTQTSNKYAFILFLDLIFRDSFRNRWKDRG